MLKVKKQISIFLVAVFLSLPFASVNVSAANVSGDYISSTHVTKEISSNSFKLCSQSLSTKKTKLLLKSINGALRNQNFAIECVTMYIKTFDEDYIEQTYSFVNIAKTYAKKAHKTSLESKKLKKASKYIKKAYKVLNKILTSKNNTATKIVNRIEKSSKYLEKAFDIIKKKC